jgi:hypothetical protein
MDETADHGDQRTNDAAEHVQPVVDEVVFERFQPCHLLRHNLAEGALPGIVLDADAERGFLLAEQADLPVLEGGGPLGGSRIKRRVTEPRRTLGRMRRLALVVSVNAVATIAARVAVPSNASHFH